MTFKVGHTLHRAQNSCNKQQLTLKSPKSKTVNVATSAIDRITPPSERQISIDINQLLATKRIKVVEFFDILKNNIESFDTINVLTFWYNLVRHVHDDNWKISFFDKSLEFIMNYTYEILHEFSDFNLACIIFDFALLGCTGPYYVEPLEESSIDRLQKNIQCFSGKALVKIIWAFAKLGSKNDNLIKLLKKAIEPELNYFLAQKDLNIAWAFEQFGDHSFVNELRKSQAIYLNEDVEDKSGDATPLVLNRPYMMDAKAITSRITAEGSSSKYFFEILKVYFRSFDAFNITTFWHRLAKNNEKNGWSVSFDDERLKAIKSYTLKNLKKFDEQGLANTFWAFAKLGCVDKKIADVFKDEIRERLEWNKQFNAQNLTNIAWAFARFGCRDINFIDILIEKIKNQYEDAALFKPQNIAMLTWSVAGFDCSDKGFIKDLKMFIIEKLRQNDFFGCKDLSSLSTASVRLGFRDSEYTEALKSAIDNKLQRSVFKEDDAFTGRNLSHISWAFAKFRCKDLKFISRLEKAITEMLQNDDDLTAANIANIIWAFAHFGYANNDFIAVLKRTIIAKLQHSNFFNDEVFSKITSSLAKLESDDDSFISASKALSSIFWAFTIFDCLDKKFMDTLKKLIFKQLEIPGFFTISELSEIAWSSAKFKCNEIDFIEALKKAIEYCLQNNNFFSTDEISVIITAFSDLEYKYDEFIEYLKAFIVPSLEYEETLNDPEVFEVTCAFDKLACSDTTSDTTSDTNVSILDQSRESNKPAILHVPYSINDTLTNPDIKLKVFFKILEENLASFDLVNVAVFWSSLAMHKNRNKWNVSFADVRLNAIKSYTYENLWNFGAEDLADIALAFSDLGFENDNFIYALKMVIENKLKEANFFSAKNLTKINLAFSNFKSINHKLINPVIELMVFFKLLEDNFDSFDLDNTIFFLVSLAAHNKILKWGVSYDDICLKIVKNFIIENLKYLCAAQLSDIILAVSELGCVDGNFINDLKRAIKTSIESQEFFTGSDLAKIDLALSNFNDTDSAFYSLIKNAISANLVVSTKDGVVTFTRKKYQLQDVGSKLVTSLNVEPVKVLMDPSDSVREEEIVDYPYNLNKFSPIRLANLALILSEDSCADDKLVEEVKREIEVKLKKPGFFGDKERAKINIALENFKSRDNHVRFVVIPHGLKKAVSQNTGAFLKHLKDYANSFSDDNVVDFWIGLASYKNNSECEDVLNGTRFKEIVDYTYKILDELCEQDLADVALSVSELSCVDDSFIEKLKITIKSKTRKPHLFTGEDLSKISLAFLNFGTKDRSFDRVVKKMISAGLLIEKRGALVTFKKRN